MDKLVRAALAGVAIGGFAAAMVTANRIALDALAELNFLAMQTAWVMTKAAFAHIQQQQDNFEDENEV